MRRRMNATLATWSCFIAVSAALALLPACSSPGAGGSNPGGSSPSAPGVFVPPPKMAEALEAAARAGTIVMVELYDTTCEYCVMMDRRTLPKPKVAEALQELTYARIHLEDEGAGRLIEHFGLEESPSYLFFNAAGEALGPHVQGFRTSRRFAAEIENFQRLARGEAPLELPKDRHPQFGKG